MEIPTASRSRSPWPPAPARFALDWVGAFLLALMYLLLAVVAVYNRRESYDTIAYFLPGANLMARGSLNIAQLGSQYGFDRFWLFNAPLMVLGEVPLLALFGVGRVQALAGIVALALFDLVAIASVCRRSLALPSAALSVLVAFAFLGTRGLATADLYNQRYAVAAFGCMALAFGPTESSFSSQRPWWRWLAGGVMPLVHPLLAPASAIFVLDAVRHRTVTRAGAIVFGICAAAALAWYGRITALMMQSSLTHASVNSAAEAPLRASGTLRQARRPHYLPGC